MLIRQAMSAFWQTLKDIWEELFPFGMVNLVWLFAWLLPIGVGTSFGNIGFFIGLILAALIFPIPTVGVYYVANRVAHGKTFHFRDFLDGMRLYWWQSLVWMLVNILFLGLVALNFWFYPNNWEGNWTVIVSGFWLAVAAFWLMMQIYFWPLFLIQEEPKLLLSWKNAVFLILANPFYAFFIGTFSIFLFVLSAGLVLPLIFVGMGITALIATNGVLILLHHLNVIPDPRPPVPHV